MVRDSLALDMCEIGTKWLSGHQKPLSLITGVCSCRSHISAYLLIQILNCLLLNLNHYSDVIMSAMASQNTGVSIFCSTVCPSADQRNHQSSASLAFVRGNHRFPSQTRKMFPFDDVIMKWLSGHRRPPWSLNREFSCKGNIANMS